ncbi:Gfo/Idh/MocA family oxidoreductase [Aurantibacter crassamenti]|uniref:Gfo/Idh/MocA family protein n=1 Tax=Aurantibacter crassamenti TaxID=1837375 RepID=UPI00193A24A1|nr:Gfo/Idh/MocA family oxidoreductase [Aurantibacter crassamenti]MBM1106502.1 Gfo/Idh/MocA family oxidoreductase [Aurantibacter crassamenti]
MDKARRNFIKKSTLASSGIILGTNAMTAKSYNKIIGANDRVRVGIAGFSNRAKGALLPAFNGHSKAQNFEIVGVSDIWNRRRDEGAAFIKELTGDKIAQWKNNEEMYDKNKIDAVLISTADFQHALHTVQAATAKKDVYCEKPFAETMDDARVGMKAVKDSGIVFQIGSQRRSGANYHTANDYIKSGKFGDIVMVEMTWNVNQPGRWRLPKLTKEIKESDVDWKRYQMNRPEAAWDPRKYLEYRLFWPYSSGIPGQWMSHQIDTVHWFSGYNHPRSVAANGGIYLWKDGRKNFDTMSAVFDYGPSDDLSSGFQVTYSSRFTNSAGGTKEIYYSNAGELNLDTNKVSDNGGLTEKYAKAMDMQPNRLKGFNLSENAPKVVTSANTGADNMTSLHMLNWMECVRSRKTTNGPIEAGYNHSIANIMTTAALRTGLKATFDEATQNVLAGGKVFKY